MKLLYTWWVVEAVSEAFEKDQKFNFASKGDNIRLAFVSIISG